MTARSKVMTNEKFESLAARLIERLPLTNSFDELLQSVADLLDGQRVILLERRGEAGEPTIICCLAHDESPERTRTWAAANLSSLRWWANQGVKAPSACGYPLDGARLSVQDVTDALVAFDPPIGPHNAGFELLVLRMKQNEAEEAFRFSTYHCAVASALLRHVIQQVRVVRHERKAQAALTDLLSLNALPHIRWSRFEEAIEDASAKDPRFMGTAAVLWWGYRRRTRSSAKIEKQERDWAAKSGGSVAAAGRLLPEPRDPQFRPLLAYLKADIFVGAELASRVLELIAAPPSSSVFGDGDVARKAALIVLEHGWRRVYRATTEELESDPQKEPPHLPSSEECQALLQITSALSIDALAGFGGAAKKRKAEAGTVLDRNVLRLYLATLIANAKQVLQQYLGVGINSSPCQPPDEVRRKALLNLSRFMFDVVRILEWLESVKFDSPPVSRVEMLDGLLYVVDRFVHEELGVDERLNLRERLAGGLSAEIDRHVGNRFYRDHLLHVVDVFLLGYLLLNARIDKGGEKGDPLVSQMNCLATTVLSPRDQIMHQHRQWAVAALLHDLGYQFDSDKFSHDDKKVVQAYFALARSSRSQLDPKSIDSEACTASGSAVDEKSRCVDWLDSLVDYLAGGSDPNKKGPSDPTWLPKLGHDTLFKDHGVLSALRVAQLLAHAGLGAPSAPTTSHRAANGLSLVEEYNCALYAIAHHNLFDQAVEYKSHPLSCLLRLCDEVQEWGRRRVNIEKMVKHLYLVIEKGDVEELKGAELLERFEANVRFSHLGSTIAKGDDPTGAKRIAEACKYDIAIVGSDSNLTFRLDYRSPIKSRYEAISAFLSKAYNFQHVELPDGGPEWRVTLRFPKPSEYRGLSELGVYNLLRLRIRDLPKLDHTKVPSTSPGLTTFADPERDSPGFAGQEQWDCVTILVKGSRAERTKGWQRCNPDEIRQQIIDSKQEVLADRVLGRKNRWIAGK